MAEAASTEDVAVATVASTADEAVWLRTRPQQTRCHRRTRSWLRIASKWAAAVRAQERVNMCVCICYFFLVHFVILILTPSSCSRNIIVGEEQES